ncbi:MAG: hypothetical protein Q6373_004515, partial [Candidatus Sigynarchaeota archaeon]
MMITNWGLLAQHVPLLALGRFGRAQFPRVRFGRFGRFVVQCDHRDDRHCDHPARLGRFGRFV